MTTKSDFNLQTDGYVAFDAISLKDLIISRMNEQQIFTDQNYEGSNLSSIIDIISYSYHVLVYYLNKNSAESNFSQAELYENINQIVKNIDYNPTGPQTANLSFEAIANANLAANIYVIPRYSYFTFNGTSYSFIQDVSFQKILAGIESLTSLQNNNLLYNGQFVEYPTITAIGENFEVITLSITDENSNYYIDNNNIEVYIRPAGPYTKWEKWSRTTSLYLENGYGKKYSVRYNENGRYEIKFGNNITGKKLTEGDQIAIYYLKSDGKSGEISKHSIDNQQLYFYNTTRFAEIKADVISTSTNIITAAESANVAFTNNNSSTLFKDKETVTEIKQNAPKLFNSQYRLVTTGDYQNYILKNFGNWIKSVSVVNNHNYLNGYQSYFFNTLQLNQPNLNSRVLFNQVNFASSCDFNNIYIFAVPNKIFNTSLDIRTNYLAIAQKNAIRILLSEIKSAATELIVTDPIYMEINLGASITGDDHHTDVVKAGDDSYLYVEVSRLSKRDIETIKNEVVSIFTAYFTGSDVQLGKSINIQSLSQSILSIDGVATFSTRRNYNGNILISDLLQLAIYNPVYIQSDHTFTDQNIPLQYFQYPYFKNLENIFEKITVVRQS
jgi:hypothetical protein